MRTTRHLEFPQASVVASAPDNGDGSDCGPHHKGTVSRCSATDDQATRGTRASDYTGAGDSGPRDKGMPSSGFSSNQQATCDDATHSNPSENDSILHADYSLKRVDTEAVKSSDTDQVRAREQLMPE